MSNASITKTNGLKCLLETGSRLYSEPEQWRFVPGKLNPADLVTRGAGKQEANKNTVWLNGPEFLASNPEEWPMTDLTPLPPDYKEIRTNGNGEG